MADKVDKKNKSYEAKQQKILEDKIDSYIDDFVKDYEKLRKDNSHMNQGLQHTLLKEPIEKLVEKVAFALGTFSKTDYLTELKTQYLVNDGSLGRKTSAFDESCKKLQSNIDDKSKVSLKSKLFDAASSLAGAVGLRQVELKLDAKAKDAQISSSMKSLNSSQKKLLHGVKGIIEKQKETGDRKVSMANHLNKNKKLGAGKSHGLS